MIPIEDLFVTGILADKCGFSKQNIPGFTAIRIDPCESEDEIVLMHDVRADEQQSMLKLLSSERRTKRNC
jgi:hypothetical protein